MKNQVKPCPFCKNRAQVNEFYYTEGEPTVTSIECKACGMKIKSHTCITQWNALGVEENWDEALKEGNA